MRAPSPTRHSPPTQPLSRLCSAPPTLPSSVLQPERPQQDPNEDNRAADARLVQRALDGNANALAELAERLRYVPRCLAVINGRRGGFLSSHDLEDLAQDVVVIVWRKLRTFVGQATLEMWVQKVSYLEFLNYIRGKGRRAAHSESSDPELVAAPASGGITPEEYERLEVVLEELGPPEADVIRLKHFEQLTFREIGEALEVSENTAKSQYYRGIEHLKRVLPKRLGRGDER